MTSTPLPNKSQALLSSFIASRNDGVEHVILQISSEECTQDELVSLLHAQWVSIPLCKKQCRVIWRNTVQPMMTEISTHEMQDLYTQYNTEMAMEELLAKIETASTSICSLFNPGSFWSFAMSICQAKGTKHAIYISLTYSRVIYPEIEDFLGVIHLLLHCCESDLGSTSLGDIEIDISTVNVNVNESLLMAAGIWTYLRDDVEEVQIDSKSVDTEIPLSFTHVNLCNNAEYEPISMQTTLNISKSTRIPFDFNMEIPESKCEEMERDGVDFDFERFIVFVSSKVSIMVYPNLRSEKYNHLAYSTVVNTFNVQIDAHDRKLDGYGIGNEGEGEKSESVCVCSSTCPELLHILRIVNRCCSCTVRTEDGAGDPGSGPVNSNVNVSNLDGILKRALKLNDFDSDGSNIDVDANANANEISAESENSNSNSSVVITNTKCANHIQRKGQKTLVNDTNTDGALSITVGDISLGDSSLLRGQLMGEFQRLRRYYSFEYEGKKSESVGVGGGKIKSKFKFKSMMAYIQQHADHRPDSHALRFRNGVIVTYENLVKMIKNLKKLIKKRVHTSPNNRNSAAIIYMERSHALIMPLIHAIIDSGISILPISVGTPLKRIECVFSDVNVCAIFIEEDENEKGGDVHGIIALARQHGVCDGDGDDSIGVIALKNEFRIPDFENEEREENEATKKDQCSDNSNDMCTIVYTSGSTGKPKGVGISHYNMSVMLDSWIRSIHREGENNIAVHKNSVLLGSGSISADVFAIEYAMALCSGACLVVCSTSELLDWSEVSSRIIKDNVNVVSGTPTLFTLWISSGWHGMTHSRLKTLKTAFVYGEILKKSLVSALVERGCIVFNGYGPSECTLSSGVFKVTQTQTVPGRDDGQDLGELTTANGTVSIGPSFDSIVYLVVDSRGNVLPHGYIGELCIVSPQVSSYQYLGARSAALNGTVFRVVCGESGESGAEGMEKRIEKEKIVLYYTGDRAFMSTTSPTHPLCYILGRVSRSQVKIHGYRVELADLEAAISECVVESGVVGSEEEEKEKEKVKVSDAAVVCVVDEVEEGEGEGGERKLIAFATVEKSTEGEGEGERERELNHQITQNILHTLRSSLPTYMIPSALYIVDSLPMSTASKVDYGALESMYREWRRGGEGREREGEGEGGNNTPTHTPHPPTPLTTLQLQMIGLYQHILNLKHHPKLTDNFFLLGGTSVVGVRLVSAIRSYFMQPMLPLSSFLTAQTIGEMCSVLCNVSGSVEGVKKRDNSIQIVSFSSLASNDGVDSTPSPTPPLIFMIHPALPTSACYGSLAFHTGSQYPFFGVERVEGLCGSVGELASLYVDAIKRKVVEIVESSVEGSTHYTIQCAIGGWSYGGLVAYEVVRLLETGGLGLSSAHSHSHLHSSSIDIDIKPALLVLDIRAPTCPRDYVVSQSAPTPSPSLTPTPTLVNYKALGLLYLCEHLEYYFGKAVVVSYGELCSVCSVGEGEGEEAHAQHTIDPVEYIVSIGKRQGVFPIDYSAEYIRSFAESLVESSRQIIEYTRLASGGFGECEGKCGECGKYKINSDMVIIRATQLTTLHSTNTTHSTLPFTDTLRSRPEWGWSRRCRGRVHSICMEDLSVTHHSMVYAPYSVELGGLVRKSVRLLFGD